MLAVSWLKLVRVLAFIYRHIVTNVLMNQYPVPHFPLFSSLSSCFSLVFIMMVKIFMMVSEFFLSSVRASLFPFLLSRWFVVVFSLLTVVETLLLQFKILLNNLKIYTMCIFQMIFLLFQLRRFSITLISMC